MNPLFSLSQRLALFSRRPQAVGEKNKRVVPLLIVGLALLGAAFGPRAATANVPGGGNSGADVSLSRNGNAAILDNGIIRATIDTPSAMVTSMRYRGVETVSQSGKTKIYFSMTTAAGYENPGNCVYSVSKQTPDHVDISCKHTYVASRGDANPFDVDMHYVLRRGSSGLYVYVVVEHQPSYPSADMNEWRQVWWMPHNNTVNTFENIYVDELRHWEMPSYYDTTIPPAENTGIAEIIKLNTGVRAGKFDCKYEYALEHYTTPTWGFASNLNNMGCWAVLSSPEYFNDGPTKQDLVSAAGIIHIYLNQDHYGGSGFTVPAGQSFKKIYGPWLLYCNNKTGADANWADAKAQASAEKAAWPYAWLDNNPAYPLAGGRGTVTGKITYADKLKPSVSSANAWVGLALPEDPANLNTNWQFQGTAYQFWTRVGADGSFSIPNVRPGAYTLYSFGDGAVGEFSKTGVSVTAGGTTTLGNLTWNVPHPGARIAWEIGTPNRTTTEFKHGSTDYYDPYLFDRLSADLPNPLEFTPGVSNPATDWDYAHMPYRTTDANGTTTSVPWKWRVNFNLDKVPPGNATLTIAYAGVDGGNQYLYVNNENRLFTKFYPAIAGGNALLREGNHAKYSVSYVSIPTTNLKVGANTITLVQASTSGNGHFMYDYLNLELPPTPAVAITPIAGLTTTEAGGTATFSAVLTTAPTSNVTVSLTSSDTKEGTVAPASLTFTGANWNVPQTVTVTGVDDAVADGNKPYKIITGAASSSDSNYSGLSVDDVSLLNLDNEKPLALISEFRPSGPGGAGDEYVEIFNNSSAPLDLSGWNLFGGASSSVLVGTVPSGKIVPVRGCLLLTGSAYSLANYGGAGAASSDAALGSDIAPGSRLELRSVAGGIIDAVSSASLPAPLAPTDNYAYVRRLDSGLPLDTDSDTGDFNLVDVQSTVGANNTTGISNGILRLGAPGPKNLSNAPSNNSLISFEPATSVPASVRVGSGNGGTLALRYLITNRAGSGKTITAFRFRVVALTAGATTPANAPAADLRLLSSTSSDGAILPFTLQEPPAQPNGGGLNSSVSLASLPGGSLAPGQSMTVELLFSVVQKGSYRFLLNAEPVTVAAP